MDSQRRKNIADRIKQLRLEAGYTNYEKFALDHNLDTRQYYRLEKGETDWKFTSINRIIDIHELTLEEFFRGIK